MSRLVRQGYYELKVGSNRGLQSRGRFSLEQRSRLLQRFEFCHAMGDDRKDSRLNQLRLGEFYAARAHSIADRIRLRSFRDV